MANGYETEYDEKAKKSFEGIYKHAQEFKGISFKNGKKVFNDEYNNSQPWNGITNEYDLSENIKQFTREIREGKPVNRSGYIFKRNGSGESLTDIEAYNEYEEQQILQQGEFEQDEAYQQQEVERWLNTKTQRAAKTTMIGPIILALHGLKES
ncbi:hypothetical protein [Bacillus cereus]|uniref:hypothetical protein n=1 Tax=Bacillus cereus TaxID=1396 RepID=UPI000BF44C93|nr:hypothetical protein [Bacillus cereus]PEY62884.1 hypothetical protein CN356_17750 [Bacillus cereus]PFT22359.1 hypothetical protein COK61_30015 [Bacillus cereus]PFW02687.1 hypothetical protein COL12_29675 [Bacillus cereus]